MSKIEEWVCGAILLAILGGMSYLFVSIPNHNELTEDNTAFCDSVAQEMRFQDSSWKSLRIEIYKGFMEYHNVLLECMRPDAIIDSAYYYSTWGSQEDWEKYYRTHPELGIVDETMTRLEATNVEVGYNTSYRPHTSNIFQITITPKSRQKANVWMYIYKKGLLEDYVFSVVHPNIGFHFTGGGIMNMEMDSVGRLHLNAWHINRRIEFCTKGDALNSTAYREHSEQEFTVQCESITINNLKYTQISLDVDTRAYSLISNSKIWGDDEAFSSDANN